jgi:hypothetical protein
MPHFVSSSSPDSFLHLHFESYRCAWRSSFINGKQWNLNGTKSALCGGYGKMVRSNFSLDTMVVCEVYGLVLSCCSNSFLCFWALYNCCFKVLSVALYHSGWWWSHLHLHPRNCSHDFPCPSLGFEFSFLQVNLCDGLTLGSMFIMIHSHFVICHNILKTFLIFS